MYEAAGGYRALRKALLEMSPNEIVEDCQSQSSAGPRRGRISHGAEVDIPAQDHPGPIYFCLNADESEPGTFNNRILMEDDPHQVLEGLIISCFATRRQRPPTSTCGTSTRWLSPVCRRPSTSATRPAIWARTSWAAAIIWTSILHRGAAAYICGEETGLIESLEGKRAWPRIKPPFPAVEGVFRKPTVVNNVETVACVTHIIERGADWFRSIGVPADPDNPRDAGSFGPKLYCLSGHVEKPGCYEAPLGITVQRID